MPLLREADPDGRRVLVPHAHENRVVLRRTQPHGLAVRSTGEVVSGPAHLERTIDADQQHRWHVKGGNGEIISANTEGHPDPRTVNASILSTLDAILEDANLRPDVHRRIAAWLVGGTDGEDQG